MSSNMPRSCATGGRVGRGKQQSYCLLFTSSKAEIALKRLNALVHTDDGFKLADMDLEIRGPGDFIGARQHGLPDIKMKNLTNLELISRCRESAKKFLSKHLALWKLKSKSEE